MTEKRFTHNGIVIVDHLKKDLIYIDGDENLLDLVEYVDKLQSENEQLKQQINTMINELQAEKETAISRNERIRLDFAITVLKELKGD